MLNKTLSILLGMLLLIMGSAAYAALPPRISWTPAQLTPASMAPGTSTIHTVILKHTGILPIPFTSQLRIVAEGAIAPFVTITQPQFPPVFKRGNQVTVPITISVPANTPAGVKSGNLVLKRILNGKEIEVWRADALQVTISIKQKDASELGTPTDPQKILLGTPQNPLQIDTKIYKGLIVLPLAIQFEPNTYFVRSGIAGDTYIAADGTFSARMNSTATSLLRVGNQAGHIILLKLFPKANDLVQVNPIIDTLSTAVALVALQPGVITTDHLIDALILAIIEKLPETEVLAQQIKTDLINGSFALNQDFSPAVKEKLELVMHRLSTLVVDDVIASSFTQKFVRYLANATSKLIKPVQADNAFVEACNDNFTDRFTGNLSNYDDVCIGALINEPGESSHFNIWNRRARWVFLGTQDSTGVDTFKLIPPRHIDIPALGDTLVDTLIAIKGTVVDFVDLAKYVYTWGDDPLEWNAAVSALEARFDERYGVLKTSADYVFPSAKKYDLATLGFAFYPPQERFLNYWSGSFALSTATEFAIPLVSVLLELSQDSFVTGNRIGGVDACLANNFNFLGEQVTDISNLRNKFAASVNSREKAEAFFIDYFAPKILLNKNAWLFVGCVFEDPATQLIVALTDKWIEKLLVEFGGPLALANKLSSGVEAGSSAALFLSTIFDSELASEDFYQAIVGDQGTPLNTLQFADSNLALCVNDTATAQNWQTVEQVTALSCAGRSISDLASLESFKSLKSLDLTGNAITDISPLTGLTQLQQLDLSGNTGIRCVELDGLAAALSSTTIVRPASCIQQSGNFVWPVVNPMPMSNPYAAFNVIGNDKYHTGFDLTSASGNTTVNAAAAGKVKTIPNGTYVNDNHGMGNVIIIDHNNGQGPFTLYAHLASIDVANGAEVKAGDPIGVMGNTGCANLAEPCGVHLHFEVKQWGVLGNVDDDLGPVWGYTLEFPNLYGYLNPWPYLDHGFTAFSPKVVRSLANQIVRTGPGVVEYKLGLGNVTLNQTFVASQQVGDWYEIDVPSENGPAKGWIQAEAATNVNHWKINDPSRGVVGVSVCPTTASCASSPTRLSYLWDQQRIVELEQAHAQNGCTKPWIKTNLLNGASGWVCSDFLTTSPNAQDDSATAQSGSAISVAVLDNDSDADGDAMTITAVTQGTNGSVVKNGSSVTYTSNPGFVGTDTFTYTVSDGKGGSDTATVTVTVAASTEGFIPWLSDAEYQAEFDRQSSDGYYPVEVEGRNFNGESQYRGKFVPFPPLPFYFYSIHGHTQVSYESINSDFLSRGYTQIFLQTFVDRDGITRYQATWTAP